MNAETQTLDELKAERDRLARSGLVVGVDAALDAPDLDERTAEATAEAQARRDAELKALDARIAAAARAANPAGELRVGLKPADPLAPPLRDRVEYLTRRLANATAPADLRDYAIALVAVAEALEKLEDLDGRVHFTRSRVEFHRDTLRALLELLGEPPDDSEHARRPWSRAYYAVREGLLDDLHHALRPRDAEGYEPANLDPADVGIFGLVVALERRRDELEDEVSRATERARVAAVDAERRADEVIGQLRDEVAKAQARIRDLEGGDR